MEPELYCIRLRSVGCRKYKKRRDFRQGAKRGLLKERPDQNGFKTTTSTIRIMITVGTSLIIL